MKFVKIYEEAIRIGIENDPRGKVLVEKGLGRIKKFYDALNGDEKKEFDLERLHNPYADSRMLSGDKNRDIKNVMVGIDIDVGEIILAGNLKNIDLVISHHPSGTAYVNFYEVMSMQSDILNNLGIPITVADNLTKERMQEVERRVMPVNYNRTKDAALLLGVNLMCLHTPADNCVATFLKKSLDKGHPETLGEIIKILKSIPEYQEASQNNAGPKILLGDKNKRSGKVFVDMTGGTEGSKEIFSRLSQAGIGTIVCMHLSEEHFKKVKEEHINVVIAGHISSDTLGLNLLLDKIDNDSKLRVTNCSGFKRIKH